MNLSPSYWYKAAENDARAGNKQPALSDEDFHREIEDPEIAAACARAYEQGFADERAFAARLWARDARP